MSRISREELIEVLSEAGLCEVLTKERLLEALRKGMKVAHDKPFRLKSGAESRLLFDMAWAVCGESHLSILLTLLSRVSVPFDAIVGPALGAGPIVWGAAPLLGVRSFLVREQAKDHGDESLFKGAFVPGERVLAVEDVVSTGSSLLSAISAIQEHGGQVVGVATLLDRGDSLKAVLAERIGIPYFVLTTYEDFGMEPVAGAPDEGFSEVNEKASSDIELLGSREVNPN